MRRKLLVVALGLFALTILVTPAFVPTSSASPGSFPTVTQHRPSGLTEQSIVNARKAGAPSRLVTMNPQTSVALLKHKATKLGMHAPDARIEIIVGLKLRNVAKLKSFLEQVQNPASPVFHEWLTPEQFIRLYGPTRADVAAVTDFLKAHHIQVTGISPNRILIHTVATTRAYNHAFGIRVNDYELDGRRFYSTTDSPKLPRAIAPLITSILGLNHGVQMQAFSHLQALGQVAPQAAPPASTAYFNPHQIAKAYEWPDITDPDNGAGVSIAILTALSPNVAINPAYHTFWNAYGLPDHTINVISVGGESGSGGGVETALDIEWSGSMAPGATLNVYVAADAGFDTFTTVYNQFVTDNNSQVMTTSWGLGEGASPDEFTVDEEIFMQATAQGISMFAASGDYGASDCHPPPGFCPPGPNNADFPSSSKYITAANGTELFIADVSGTYGSERAWAGTGGAISMLFERPDWQIGPGMPADMSMRMNSDMALNAGGLHPYLVYLTVPPDDGFYGIAGTSAVAPIFAGLFAIGVSQHDGERLGQSNKLIYDAVNAAAQNYAEDFHDVTEGCNGYLPDGQTESCAKPLWDHPTGWGSPKATNLLADLETHPAAGTLVGTVTAASSGAPIAGATVTINPGEIRRTTQEDGSYSVKLLVGDYSVTVGKFGYVNGTASISIADDEDTSQDFSLAAAPSATLSGTVTDGSGHGYSLYAGIQVSTPKFGQVALVWTDPETGKYNVELPKGFDYMLHVTAAFNGYNPDSATLTFTGNATRNFDLTVIAACTAPGYAGNFSEDFNASFPPAGWKVTSVIPDAQVVWKLNSAWYEDNVTGGTGAAADADSAAAGPGSGSYDTSLVTPPIPVASLPSTAILRYKANYLHLADALDLDISTDDGATWTTISHWTTSHGTYRSLPGYSAEVDLTSYLPATGSFRLRWHYYSEPGKNIWNFYAMVDDVVIGDCEPTPGGVILGQVTDANTGKGIVGAHVKTDQGAGVETLVNSADPSLPTGIYEFFAKSGKLSLTATEDNYSSATVQVNLTNNAVVRQDFALKSGKLVANPGDFTLHVMVNSSATAAFALKNTGTGKTHFKIRPIEAPPPKSAHEATGPFAPVPNYHQGRHINFAAPTARGMSNMGARRIGTRPTRDWLTFRNDPTPHAAGDSVFHFPAGITIYGLGVDHNLSDLWLGSPFYRSFDGDSRAHRFLFDGTNTGDSIDVGNPDVMYMADMAFNDNTGMLWQLSIDMPSGASSHIIELDPTTMQPTGDSILVPSPHSVRGLAYDPLSNTWYAGDFFSNTIYHFDASGTLLDSANVGLPIIGLAYNSTSGRLFVLTSAGRHVVYILDAKDGYAQLGWFDIDGFDTLYSGAGMGYDCDNNLWITDYVNNIVWQVDSGETGWCVEKDIAWLTTAPKVGTVAAGASTEVVLTFDGADQKAFTTSTAYLSIESNTPYGALIVPLTVTWDPQPVNLVLTGEASSNSLQKGDKLTYTLAVKNTRTENHGAASETTLIYTVPNGLRYIAASGDANCTAPSMGSSSVPAAASASSLGVLSCEFGALEQGASKTLTIAVQAVKAGTFESTFKVSAREPDSDPSTNSLTLETTVTGTSDVGIKTAATSVPEGGTGQVTMTVRNAGPDTATDVTVKVSVGSNPIVSLSSAQASQGSCTAGSGGLVCDLGDVASGANATMTVTLTGQSIGAASVAGQVTTSADDPNLDNNMAVASVSVKASDDGGGALGWWALAALLGLGLSVATLRHQGRRDSTGS